ncbi:MAG TPA: SGNH/GDSL hydrolase family protein [Pseudonocardiaceae bacterium]|nr:SGNH/GDSL hydrolase family protein [Pseudonocardiaceae bacterium]
MGGRRRVLSVCAVFAAFVGVAAGQTSAGAVPTFSHYVALGDSYASGPLIPNQSLHPVGCGRSDHDYAGDLARSMGIPSLVDVSCGGADTTDMTSPQSVPLGGTNQPQFDALTAATDLVTVTIGGNDIGFTSIVETCAEQSITNPFGAPCRKHYTAGGTDQLAAAVDATAPKVAAVLAGIRQRAPHARVVVVGYLRILPPTTGCWPVMPIAAGDVPYLDGVEHELNAMLGARAAAAGDVFVNPGNTTGHDVCQPESRKWVEGVVPTNLAFPVHPNAAGMAEVASLLRAAVG